MHDILSQLVQTHFGRMPLTYKQLKRFYEDYAKGPTIFVMGAGRNTIDASEGAMPLINTHGDAHIFALEPDTAYFERAQQLAKTLSAHAKVNIEVFNADPLEPVSQLPVRADSIIFPRTLHELLLMHSRQSDYMEKLTLRCANAQEVGCRLLIVEPNYRSEVYDDPRQYTQEILTAIDHIADRYGHFHPPAELPEPRFLAKEFERAGYQLIETAWKANEATELSSIAGAHFTVFEKVS
ncbi:MAG: hypothetical protein L0387_42765 [Acidobacteria bacterium]|nr:hypothetical protein [Acidobacteriota bacterium]